MLKFLNIHELIIMQVNYNSLFPTCKKKKHFIHFCFVSLLFFSFLLLGNIPYVGLTSLIVFPRFTINDGLHCAECTLVIDK
jgi:hypothetical protein